MNIKEILKEIYMIDPELKNHEKDLEKIIIELSNQKPDVVIDQVFIKSLREKLMPEEKIQNEEIVQEKPGLWSFANLAFGGVGALVMLLAMLPFLTTDKDTVVNNIAKQSGQMQSKIIEKGSRAFGSLLATDAAKSDGVLAKGESDLAASAPIANSTVASRTMGMGGGGGGTFLADEAKMIAPYFPSYTYKYVGDELELSTGEADVYKRIAGAGFNVALDNILSNIQVAPINISKLENPVLQSFSFMEDKDYGLQLMVNVADGSIDFSQNWLKWQEHYPKCNDEACWEQNRMKMENMPSDEAVIAIAKDFVANYGIDLSSFGNPVVRDDWRNQYERASDKTFVYIPEDVQVIYPILVNGESVYDGSGYPYGVGVNVNVKFMKVSGMYSLRASDYESSKYALEADKDRIIKIAERGGSSPIYYANDIQDGDQKLETVELGTPKKVLMSHWHYDESKQESYELFVPALVFPITKMPENTQYFYQESVVIPLVKEILDTYNMNYGGGDRPVPMLKGEDGAASSGSAGSGEVETLEAVDETLIAPEAAVQEPAVLKR